MADLLDVAIIGAGAAGVAAGRRLAKAGASFVILEARERVGGRTLTLPGAHALDMGAEWLHSGDRNVMVAIGEALGFEIDRSEAPWQKQTAQLGITAEEQRQFGETFQRFEKRIDAEAEKDGEKPASFYLEPGAQWNALLDAVFSYISGARLDEIDARDYARYEDTGVNWRVRRGYGALIAACAAPLPVRLGVSVREVDFSGAHVRLETMQGVVEARSVIVAVPTSAYATLRFTPDLPEKRAAAAVLPLGFAEKLYFELSEPDEFPTDGHFFARFDSADTGSYHLRPMGRPLIEVYFGGALARGLAEAGAEAMADFAKQELANLLGANFPSRVTTLAASSWALDPLARGSYSYATPGNAEQRAVLAASVAERVFFAGEACSRARYSTVHGAFQTGHEAAEAVLAQLSPSPRA